eukprot:TRINITY_DN253_c0_g1_i1.p1 TRINITY_DN253_c0_g1~~TRINITY_DN253_c0_g1_i1.p1  ORF type:complete len:148 (-),score=17.02 TRINITY_DN253_c0_g1_i1:148-543(-)
MADFDNLLGQDRWEVGLFECTEDVGTCIVDGWLCGLCSSAVQLSRLGDEPGMDLVAIVGHLLCAPCFFVYTRREIRRRYLLRGNILEDIFSAICCHPCAVTQQANQMALKGDKPCQLIMGSATSRSFMSTF